MNWTDKPFDLAIKEYAIALTNTSRNQYGTTSLIVVFTVSAIATMALFAAKMLGLNIAVTK